MSIFRRARVVSVAGIPDRDLKRMSRRDREAYLKTYRVGAREWTPAQLAQMEKLAAAARRGGRSR